MKRVIVIAAGLCATAAPASDRGWAKASNATRTVLIAAALGVPAVEGDWAGDLQAGGSVLAALGTTSALKEIFPERRPDGSDRKSFPSGHAATAFAAAASLENRYGWRIGAPALAIATFVGVARVEARKHFWYDVVAGAAIGTTSGLLLTRQRNANIRLMPWAQAHGGGLALAMRF